MTEYCYRAFAPVTSMLRQMKAVHAKCAAMQPSDNMHITVQLGSWVQDGTHGDTIGASGTHVTTSACAQETKYFQPGVTEAFTSKLLWQMETTPAWTEVTPWSQQVDRSYFLSTGMLVKTTTEVVPLASLCDISGRARLDVDGIGSSGTRSGKRKSGRRMSAFGGGAGAAALRMSSQVTPNATHTCGITKPTDRIAAIPRALLPAERILSIVHPSTMKHTMAVTSSSRPSRRSRTPARSGNPCAARDDVTLSAANASLASTQERRNGAGESSFVTRKRTRSTLASSTPQRKRRSAFGKRPNKKQEGENDSSDADGASQSSGEDDDDDDEDCSDGGGASEESYVVDGAGSDDGSGSDGDGNEDGNGDDATNAGSRVHSAANTSGASRAGAVQATTAPVDVSKLTSASAWRRFAKTQGVVGAQAMPPASVGAGSGRSGGRAGQSSRSSRSAARAMGCDVKESCAYVVSHVISSDELSADFEWRMPGDVQSQVPLAGTHPDKHVAGQESTSSSQCVVRTDRVRLHDTRDVATGACLPLPEPYMHGMRMVLTKEITVFEDELQRREDECQEVCIRLRRSFKYTPQGMDRAVWATTVTLAWRAGTFTDALRALQSGMPTFDVVLRCLEPMEYLASINNDCVRFAASLVLKAADMFRWCRVPGTTHPILCTVAAPAHELATQANDDDTAQHADRIVV